MKHFSKEQLQKARRTNLYDYLLSHHAEQFKSEQKSLRPVFNHSISIRQGYCGYKDFANDETGNSVDFLVKHMGYALDEAVFSLTGENSSSSVYVREKAGFMIPAPDSGTYRCLFAYLLNRGITKETIQMLIHERLLYQAEEYGHKNIIFLNREKDWVERHGTISYGKSWHGVAEGSRTNGFWSFGTGRPYICEAAIDAISLYEIHRITGKEPGMYVSIGGVGKQAAIDRLKDQNPVLAVDNDPAGDACRKKNPDLFFLIPVNKDWNEDLKSISSFTKNTTSTPHEKSFCMI